MRHLQGVRQVQSTELQGFFEKDSIVRFPRISLIIRINKLPPNADMVPTQRHHCEAEGSPLMPHCVRGYPVMTHRIKGGSL